MSEAQQLPFKGRLDEKLYLVKLVFQVAKQVEVG